MRKKSATVRELLYLSISATQRHVVGVVSLFECTMSVEMRVAPLSIGTWSPSPCSRLAPAAPPMRMHRSSVLARSSANTSSRSVSLASFLSITSLLLRASDQSSTCR